VAIPADLGEVMETDLGLAVAWREATRAVFSHYLASGYEVRYFQRGAPTSTYALARRSSDDR
jgi:predicted GNAT superfamily acetyltransferase